MPRPSTLTKLAPFLRASSFSSSIIFFSSGFVLMLVTESGPKLWQDFEGSSRVNLTSSLSSNGFEAQPDKTQISIM